MLQRVVDSAKMELTDIVSEQLAVAWPLSHVQHEAVTDG